MKAKLMRHVLIVCLFLMAALPSFAYPPDEDVLRPYVPSRGKFYIEPHAGINFTFLNGNARIRDSIAGEGAMDSYESATGLGPLFGVTFGYPLNSTYALELSLDYSSFKASNSATTGDLCIHRASSGGPITSTSIEQTAKEYTLTANYLSIGVLATYRLNSFLFFAGPSVSIPLSNDFLETNSILDSASGCRYFKYTANETQDINGTLDDSTKLATRISLKIGVGYFVKIGSSLMLVPRLAYDFGVSDTYSSSNGSGAVVFRSASTNSSANVLAPKLNDAIRLSALQLSLGLRINI
jgi:hypothetical protein